MSKSGTTELEKPIEAFRKETTPKMPPMLAQHWNVFTCKHEQGRRRGTKWTPPMRKQRRQMSPSGLSPQPRSPHPPTHTHKKPIPKKDASDDMHASPPAPDAITRTTGVPSAHTATRSHFQLGRQDVGPTAGPTHRPRKAQHGGVWLRPQAMTAKAEGHPLAMEGHHCKKVVEAPLLPSCRGRSSLSRSAPPA